MPFNTFIGVVTKKSKKHKNHLLSFGAALCHPNWAACMRGKAPARGQGCMRWPHATLESAPPQNLYIKKIYFNGFEFDRCQNYRHELFFFFFFKSSGLIRFGKECG